MSPYYPMMVNLSAKRCVVVGGGPVAERKTLGLLDGGARELIVVAPRVTGKLDELAADGSIALRRREYRDSDADGAFLLIVASNDRQLNARLSEYAESRGILVNTVDLGERGTFITPSVVRRGALVIALTTGGASPALTALLKRKLDVEYGPAYERFVGRLHALRKRVMAEVGDPGLRATVLRLAAEELPPEREPHSDFGHVEKQVPEELELQHWMIRLLEAAERGR